MFEIDKLFEEYQRYKFKQFDTYQQRAHDPMFDSVIGYVADVDDMSRMRNAYNVIVPSMQSAMLRDVPRNIPDGFIHANGVGHLPAPLRPGQPVLIRFNQSRSSLPYIDGSFALNGQFELWTKDSIPQLDKKDLTDLALFPSPLPPEAQAVKGNAEVKVHPLILRLSSPTQPPNSATALEVPGTTYITDIYGNVFTYFAGERIVVGKNEQKVNAGARQSMADMPKDEAVKKSLLLKAQMLEKLTHWRSALAGEITIQSPHPASKRQRSDLDQPGDFAGSLSVSQSGISGQFTINTGVKVDTASLKSAFDTIDGISNLLSKASALGGKHLKFIQKVILPLINKLKALWGAANGFGLQQLSFQIDLPFNLKLSISVKFDAKTGKLSIKASLGFGSGTPISGSQPLPLRSEGAVIAGGYERQIDYQIVVRTTVTEYYTSTIYADYPELAGSVPNLNSATVPYTHVARELSDLNFSERPSDALASLVTQYGVPEAYSIVKYLLPLVRYGSLFDFLKIGAVLANKLDTIIITTGITYLGGIEPDDDPNKPRGDIFPEINDLFDTIPKPAVVNCPTLPSEVYQVVRYAQQKDPMALPFLQDYFQIEIPDFLSWLEDINNFMDWLQVQQHAYFAPLYALQQGRILDFFILLIYLKTGVDVRAYPRAYAELDMYVQLAFVQPRIGVA